jgi:hypothetical protein
MNPNFWKGEGNSVLVYSNLSNRYATLEPQLKELGYVE